MPKPKKSRRRKDTLLYMLALQMMEGLSLIEEQGNTSNSPRMITREMRVWPCGPREGHGAGRRRSIR